MPKLPVITGEKLAKVLCKKGFIKIRQESSHVSLWREQDNKHITIPMHGGTPLGKGLLSRILKDIGLPIDELRKLL